MGGGEPGSGCARPDGRVPRFGFHEPHEDMAEKLDLDVQRTTASPADNFAQDGETLPPNVSPVNQAIPIDAVGKMDISITSPDNFASTSASTSGLFSDPFLDSSSDRNGLGHYCSSDARIGEGEIFAISRICGHEDFLENLDTPCPCCGSTRLKYIHQRQPSADTISESCHQPCKDGCETSPRCKACGAEFNEVLKSMERDMQAFKAKYVKLFEGIGRDMQALRKAVSTDVSNSRKRDMQALRKAVSTEVSNSRKRDMQAIRAKSNEGCIAKDVDEFLELCVVFLVLVRVYLLGPPLLGRL